MDQARRSPFAQAHVPVAPELAKGRAGNAAGQARHLQRIVSRRLRPYWSESLDDAPADPEGAHRFASANAGSLIKLAMGLAIAAAFGMVLLWPAWSTSGVGAAVDASLAALRSLIDSAG
jgi:hypothetical protein